MEPLLTKWTLEKTEHHINTMDYSETGASDIDESNTKDEVNFDDVIY